MPRNYCLDAVRNTREFASLATHQQLYNQTEVTMLIYEAVMLYLLAVYHDNEDDLEDLPSYTVGVNLCNVRDILSVKFPEIRKCLGNIAELQYRYGEIINNRCQVSTEDCHIFCDVLNATSQWFCVKIDFQKLLDIYTFYCDIRVIAPNSDLYRSIDNELGRIYIGRALNIVGLPHLCSEVYL